MNSNNNTFNVIFLDLYTQYSDSIFRFCFMKTSRREVALDLTQETFTKFWEYMSSGHEVQESKALIYRIATNLVIDYYRKKKSDSLDILTENGFDFRFEENQSIETKFEIEQLHTKIQLLPDKYKDILIMRYVDDMSVKEIAQVYDEQENTISVRIHRAIEKLKQTYTTKEHE